MPSASYRITAVPELGPELPRQGNALTRALGRWVLRAIGWRIEGEIPNLPKLVIIAAPHTSNWDFVVGIAAKMALGLRVVFLGKDTLFRFPLGPLMRAWGGMPVERSIPNAVVTQMVAEFGRRDRMVLALAPEGTRKAVERWRTGFYHIAHAAGVPIVPVALNFGERAVQIGNAFTSTGDVEGDIQHLQSRFAGVRGRRSKKASVMASS